MSSEELGLLIKRVQHRHHRAIDAALTPLGISLVQWNALRMIDRHPESPQRRLAELTFNSDQAFGTLSTRLETAGWVERTPGPSRARHLSLTREGKALLAEGQKRFNATIEQSFSRLDEEERAALQALLVKLLG